MEPSKKPGRPPKHGVTMTPAQRAAQYRKRRHEGGAVAHEHVTTASDADLLAGLARQVKAMAEPDRAEAARYIAGQLMAEICFRHGIDIPAPRA